MLSSVLIANRGEIACRVIRTARRLGMRTIAVHSEADRGAMFVALADEAHAIGGAAPGDSYLRIDRIMEAAARSGAASIHPGYGFLSERAEFADACAAAGIVFVGPPASAIRAMGLKDAAKSLVAQAGVPVVPGYHGSRQEPDFLRQKAYEIGYPVLIKAVAGGGGKGMRRVDKQLDFEAALASAQREAQSAFGDPRVLVEKYVLSPRHVEVQVFADGHGNVVHLFERDCSLQRRHQKVIEEAPAPGITAEMRAVMGQAAVEAARSVGYVGAGTVEFIADAREGLRPDRFFFMEMNTRLQVEHPVTEAITGLDLVELQFRVAAGERLPFSQDDLAIDGHAVEARLYAEDPERGFLPSTGRLWALRLPDGEGIRVDTGVRGGDEVTPFYDPMIAKIVAHGPDRDTALDRLSVALAQTIVAGPRTNTAFLHALCGLDEFRSGRFDTGTIERHLDGLTASEQDERGATIAAAALCLARSTAWTIEAGLEGRGGADRDWRDPWSGEVGFGLMRPYAAEFPVVADGDRVAPTLLYHEGTPLVRIGDRDVAGEADIVTEGFEPDGGPLDRVVFASGIVVMHDDQRAFAFRDGRQIIVERFDPFAVDLEHLDAGDAIKAPMHGKLIAVDVAPGDRVEKGQRLAIVEAMKMEHALLAPRAGLIADVLAAAGDQVAENARLIVFEAETGRG